MMQAAIKAAPALNIQVRQSCLFIHYLVENRVRASVHSKSAGAQKADEFEAGIENEWFDCT